MNTLYRNIIIAVLFLCAAEFVHARRIEGSPHDLSSIASGGTCNYCHTPHGAMRGTPLWNHKLSDVVYKIYESSSLEAKVGQPTGTSKLCLSCHDGSVALTHTQDSKGATVFITPGTSNLGTDLSDDHPISFVYSDELAVKDSQLKSPSQLPEQFTLDQNGELQCTTCHDPHDNQHGDFLRMSTAYSQMCVTCHDLKGWNQSAHQTSTSQVTNSSDKYLKKSKYSTVAENGCNSCHRPHSAGGAQRLLHFRKSEQNCLNCHDGKVASTDFRPIFSKTSKHNVKKYDQKHDLKELAIDAPMHVECVDCHNPHTVTADLAQAPMASGMINGVSGITSDGSVVDKIQFQYELCFKCHADNPDRMQSKITRQITQTNTRYEFDISNPSFHPVTTQGVNDNVPSLKIPRTIADIIYCTDCHNSEKGSSVKGPHGSSNPHLLAYNYETEDYTSESQMAYELCYTCHSRNSILNDESFTLHSKHLSEHTPCSACHDPHGISVSQGNSINNTHLINFDTTIVRRNNLGDLRFEDEGTFAGNCSLLCHGKDHDNESY